MVRLPSGTTKIIEYVYNISLEQSTIGSQWVGCEKAL